MWEKINSLLKKQNMTLYELAKRTQLTPSTLYSFKYGQIKKPSFELIEKIADVLDVSMDEFRNKN